MEKIIRHCGVFRNTGTRVFVVWRHLEGDPEHCLVIFRDSLPEIYVNKVTDLVLERGQSSVDLWDVMDKIGILDGSNMLTVLHKTGYLKCVKTSEVDMHIGGNNKIPLNVLNQKIKSTSQQRDGTVKGFNPYDNSEIDYPEQGTIVERLIADADKYEQLAKETRERAYNLDPTKRPSSTESVVEDSNIMSFTCELDLSQSKAIELFKKAFKAAKEGTSE